MEPQIPTPTGGYEQQPVNYGQNHEIYPSSSPEVGFDNGQERVERRPEVSSQQMPAMSLPTPVMLPTIPVVTPVVAPSNPVSASPAVAADEDLIEKEWVDRAKNIILQTKDDPYRREQEVGKLQADYLQKRYGKELGASQ